MLTTLIPNRIRQIREERGITLEDLEERTGLSNGYLSRIERGKRKLSLETLELIAGGLDVDPRLLIIDIDSFETIDVLGTVQGGLWVESFYWGTEKRYSIAVPRDKRFSVGERFGAEVVGSASNLRYPEGTIVICVRVPENFVPEEPETRYLIQRMQDAQVETTIRKFHIDPRGNKWLVSETTEPEFQTPIPFSELLDGGIVVLARVTGSFVRE